MLNIINLNIMPNFYILLIFIFFLIILLFFYYLKYYNIDYKYKDQFFYLKKNINNFNSDIFYRELELFIKKIISIKFRKPEILYLNTEFIIKTYNWKLINILKEISLITSDIDKINQNKYKKRLLNKLLKELKK